MAWLQNLPLKRKVTLVVALTCSIALLLACAVLAAYEMFDFRRTMARDITVLADVLAQNSQASLSFQDERAARETLLALQAEPYVVAACLYDKEGNRFVQYTPNKTEPQFPIQPGRDAAVFKDGHLELFRPVALNEKRIGTIYIQASLHGVYNRLRLFGGIATLVLAGSFLIAFALSSRLQRSISEPILMLAETARVIADRKDYSVRAMPRGEQNEIGVLTNAFNQMLIGIQEREKALQTANDSLRSSEAQLQTIVENLAEGVAVSSLDGQMLHFNRAALEMHGFTSLEECHQHVTNFAKLFELSSLTGTVLPLEEWPLSRILRGEKLNDLEVQIRNLKSGRQHIFGYGGNLVRNASGQPLMAVVTIKDITDRKQSETKLQAQLSQINLLNQITRAIGERQDLASIFQVVIRSVEDNLPIDFSCVCLYEESQNMLTVTSVGVRSEALAVELAMTAQAHVPIDQNGLSRCVRGQLVYEPDICLVNFPFPQRLMRGGLRSLVAAPLLVESKVFGVFIAARRQPEGFSSSECEFLRQLSEHVALAAHQVQLYTALQQAYDDLRQTQQAVMQQERLRALGQMASGIAHDINNAISPVALYTESMLETEPHLTERGRDYLQTIARAIDDVSATVARMREFYRQREPQLLLAPVRLNQLAQQVVDLTRARWSDMPQQRGLVIQLHTDLAPDIPSVMGIESEIREALTNLIFNAVDAMPEGGTLTLRTRVQLSKSNADQNTVPSHVHVEVADSGIGMDEDTRRRCLEPFFTTKGERGTGLGLAMVYGVVKRHGAEMEIESSPGQGTTVRLSFFVTPIPTVESPRDNAAVTVPKRLRLLVIDDDPLLIKSLRDTLETDGHVIITANGGQAGIDAFRAARHRGESFAAVITDLGMPYVDGRKVAAALKEMSPHTPIILLTGWGQRLVAEGDIPPHVNKVLNKPPKLRELREALAEFSALH